MTLDLIFQTYAPEAQQNQNLEKSQDLSPDALKPAHSGQPTLKSCTTMHNYGPKQNPNPCPANALTPTNYEYLEKNWLRIENSRTTRPLLCIQSVPRRKPTPGKPGHPSPGPAARNKKAQKHEICHPRDSRPLLAVPCTILPNVPTPIHAQPTR